MRSASRGSSSPRQASASVFARSAQSGAASGTLLVFAAWKATSSFCSASVNRAVFKSSLALSTRHAM
eukprot:scaffold149_cov315-Pinguiococcus_pyrenoidosus.AAC.138